MSGEPGTQRAVAVKTVKLDSTGTLVKGSGWGDLTCRLLVGKSAEFLSLAVLNSRET